MSTHSFTYRIQTEDLNKYIETDEQGRFFTNKYSKDDNKTQPIRKIERVIYMMKYELGVKL